MDGSPDLKLENSLWRNGYQFVAGIDEVGRGSWAGPLVAAGIILPQDFKIPGNLDDSKMLKHQVRVQLAAYINKTAVSIAVAEVSSFRIDKIGLARANGEVFRKVVRILTPTPDFCLVDAFHIKYFSPKKQMAVKFGDKISASIAAASIIAKVYRDKLMRSIHFKYPQYDFGENKGYGTKRHQDAIQKFGFSKIHRMSYNLSYLNS